MRQNQGFDIIPNIVDIIPTRSYSTLLHHSILVTKCLQWALDPTVENLTGNLLKNRIRNLIRSCKSVIDGQNNLLIEPYPNRQQGDHRQVAHQLIIDLCRLCPKAQTEN